MRERLKLPRAVALLQAKIYAHMDNVLLGNLHKFWDAECDTREEIQQKLCYASRIRSPYLPQVWIAVLRWKDKLKNFKQDL